MYTLKLEMLTKFYRFKAIEIFLGLAISGSLSGNCFRICHFRDFVARLFPELYWPPAFNDIEFPVQLSGDITDKHLIPNFADSSICK